jgi:hypothetical protein
MESHELIKRIQDMNGITEGRARGAYTTYLNIRQVGFEVVKGYMSRRTFFLHLKHLRGAGVNDASLYTGNVIQFKPVRVVLAKPVGSWDEIRAAIKAA